MSPCLVRLHLMARWMSAMPMTCCLKKGGQMAALLHPAPCCLHSLVPECSCSLQCYLILSLFLQLLPADTCLSSALPAGRWWYRVSWTASWMRS